MRTIEDEVSAAYQWILGRSADQGGLQHYAGLIRSGQLEPAGLRKILMESAEFGGIQPAFVMVEMDNGVKVVVDPQEPEFGRHIAASRTWEPHIINAIRSALTVGATFVDIGGNVGIMSLQAADLVGPTGKVIAFEPNVDNVSAFRRGILANGFDHVIVYPFALSDRRQMISLTSASNAKVTGDAEATQRGNVIQAIPADELLEREDRIDLVKIDIEGFELPALKGMERALARHQPKILCEFNPLCLRAQGGEQPEALANYLMGLSPVADLVEHDGSTTRVMSADQLMDLWHRRDREATQKGVLPPGWVHFDILIDLRG